MYNHLRRLRYIGFQEFATQFPEVNKQCYKVKCNSCVCAQIASIAQRKIYGSVSAAIRIHVTRASYVEKTLLSCLPWNKGTTFQAPIPLSDMNCPSDTSRKNMGIPPIMTQMKYGNKKAPANRLQQNYASFTHRIRQGKVVNDLFIHHLINIVFLPKTKKRLYKIYKPPPFL